MRGTGGESVLEWSGDSTDGAPDGEFGRLVMIVPKSVATVAPGFMKRGW